MVKGTVTCAALAGASSDGVGGMPGGGGGGGGGREGQQAQRQGADQPEPYQPHPALRLGTGRSSSDRVTGPGNGGISLAAIAAIVWPDAGDAGTSVKRCHSDWPATTVGF